jgi:hypothetical protein
VVPPRGLNTLAYLHISIGKAEIAGDSKRKIALKGDFSAIFAP